MSVHLIASRNAISTELDLHAVHCTCGHLSTGTALAGANAAHDAHVRRMIERAVATRLVSS